jgi:hypothetical protein
MSLNIGDYNLYLGAFVVVAIIIIIYIFTSVLNTNNSIDLLFDGFYCADPVFCEEGNLESMIFYFDKGDGYIMIKGADGTVLLNDVVQYTLVAQSYFSTSISKPHTYKIIFKGIDYQDFFPTTQLLEFIPSTQRIKLYDDDEKKIHAILYKNNAVTDVKQLLPDADTNTNADHYKTDDGYEDNY